MASCEEPACHSKEEMLRKAFARTGGGGVAAATGRTGGSGGGASSSVAACPPDRDELGRNTWALLHSAAAHYPDAPAEAERAHARAFVHALGALYPCSWCANDFREAVEESPPPLHSREGFSVWMCEMHNRVNEKLGKPLWPCDIASLDLRWRRGGPECTRDEH